MYQKTKEPLNQQHPITLIQLHDLHNYKLIDFSYSRFLYKNTSIDTKLKLHQPTNQNHERNQSSPIQYWING